MDNAIIYLTPASLSYLNQFILAFVITAYLGWRFFLKKGQDHSATDGWLVFFFIAVTVLLLALFLEASFLPTERLMVVYALNTILARVPVYRLRCRPEKAAVPLVRSVL